jgi:acetyltransferase
MKTGSIDLSPLFHPASVAVAGASPNFPKWGAIILHNILRGGYTGRVYPVNPTAPDIFGVPAYPSIREIPDTVDLVFVVVPPKLVEEVLIDAAEKGVRMAVVITAGFSETGSEGKKIEESVASRARSLGINLVGPNCMGLASLSPHKLTAWMPSFIPTDGPVSIISQSGNVSYSLTRALTGRGVGICRSISSGNEADLTMSDFIRALGEDEHTRVILSYVEGVDKGREFICALRETTPKKPVVILKAGHTDAGARAGNSHTGAMAGTDELYEAAILQTGALRAASLDQLIDFASVLINQPLPRGNRVGILTLGGGWGVLSADALEMEGLSVTPLRDDTIATLNDILPSWWSRGNPVDTVAGLKEGDLKKSLEALLSADNVDALVLCGFGYGTARGSFFVDSPFSGMYGMKAMGEKFIAEDEETARGIVEMIDAFKKPIIPVVDQGVIEQRGRFVEILKDRGVLLFPSPRRAAASLAALCRYAEHLRQHAGRG